jgi:kynureninase
MTTFPSPEPGLARELDRQDPLANYRNRFLIADPDLIYLDGNSLGRLPRRTASQLQEAVVESWGKRLIRGWNEGWFDLPHRLGSKLAGGTVPGKTRCWFVTPLR